MAGLPTRQRQAIVLRHVAEHELVSLLEQAPGVLDVASPPYDLPVNLPRPMP